MESLNATTNLVDIFNNQTVLSLANSYLNNIGTFTINAIKVIFVLGLLIFIHELGHFLTAKAAGIKVHEFALGFGRKLISFTKGETDYSIRLIPMGGFVRMEGEEEQSDDERAFNKKPILARLAVVIAGPLMNILLAVAILFILVFISGNYISNQIEEIQAGSGALKAGLKPGDKIIKLDEENIRSWDDINWYMIKTDKDNVIVTIVRNNQVIQVPVETYTKLNFELDSYNQVKGLNQDSALTKMGLKNGDKIRKINGMPVTKPDQVLNVIKSLKTKIITFSVLSKDKEIDKPFDASLIRRNYMGVIPVQRAGSNSELVNYSFYKSFFLIKVMIQGVYDLVTGNVSVNQVMGPVGIISEISSQKMIADLLWLAAIISLNLGIINLVPFPPLDGGKVLTLCLEAIRRKPIKPETEAMISMIGFSLLILLMIVATYNDVLRKIATG